MPGRDLSRSSSLSVIMQHDSASDFLAVAYPTLHRHEASSNIVLAHALKRIGTEAALSGYQFISDSDVELGLASADTSSFTPHPTEGAFWLTMWSSTPSSIPRLDLVLSCVDWTLGNYPIFLWAPHHPTSLSAEWLIPRITQLAEHLRLCVPPERVFSVFGMSPLVKTFASIWTDMTGFQVEPEPFYAAYFTVCTPESFRASNAALPTGDCLRRATPADLEAVAQLCQEFAEDSIFFPLTIEDARIEARELITKGQIWVYDTAGQVTTICAVTRSSNRVSAITKVFTTPRWRRRGYAEYLTRYVTAKLLFDCGKDSVTLYVGHENSAQKVYHRVGFVGLCGDKSDLVEDSLELGFKETDRGHW